MRKIDLKAVISQVEPTTKAAQLRQVMPEIEEKLAAGVTLAQLHEAMTKAGFEVAFETLKTYLYQHRRKSRRAAPPLSPSGTAPPKHATAAEQGPVALPDPPPQSATAAAPAPTTSQQASSGQPPVAAHDLVRLMRPDPQSQAADYAEYERLGKEIGRQKRKPPS